MIILTPNNRRVRAYDYMWSNLICDCCQKEISIGDNYIVLSYRYEEYGDGINLKRKHLHTCCFDKESERLKKEYKRKRNFNMTFSHFTRYADSTTTVYDYELCNTKSGESINYGETIIIREE